MDNDNEVKEKLKALFIEFNEFSERVQEPPPSLQDFCRKCLANSDLKSRVILPLKVICYFYSLLCSKVLRRSYQQALSDRLSIYMSSIRKRVVMGVPGYEPILSAYDSFISDYRTEKKFSIKPLLFFIPYFVLIRISFDEKNWNLFFNLFLNFFDSKSDFFNTIKSGLTPYMVGISLFIYSLVYGFIYFIFRDFKSVYMLHMLKLYKTHSLFDVICILGDKYKGKVIREMDSSELEQIEQDLDKIIQIKRRKPTDLAFTIAIYRIFIQSLACIMVSAFAAFVITSSHDRFFFTDSIFNGAIIIAFDVIYLGYIVRRDLLYAYNEKEKLESREKHLSKNC